MYLQCNIQMFHTVHMMDHTIVYKFMKLETKHVEICFHKMLMISNSKVIDERINNLKYYIGYMSLVTLTMYSS